MEMYLVLGHTFDTDREYLGIYSTRKLAEDRVNELVKLSPDSNAYILEVKEELNKY